ncbi:MAG: flagellar hook-length control protein FliK [Steroidobacteraceae bacterium]
MRIDLLSANDPRTTTATPLRSMWRVGAILEAIAVRDVATGQLWLQLDNQKLPARLASGHSTGPLDGEHLKLRVLRDTPVLALEALDESTADHTTDNALRRYLPRQSSPTPLLANLGWLARNAPQVQSLPRAVQQALATLWQGMPDAATLQEPSQLRQALLHSGTFLEAGLARETGGQAVTQLLSQDFKAGLLALREQLRNLRLESGNTSLPPGPMPTLHAPLSAMATGPASLAVLDEVAGQLSELKQQTDGSLARITTNQLLNAEAAQQGLLGWLIELPVRHEDRAELLRFKFEREPRQQTGGSSSWTVEVALDLGTHGALHAQIHLTGKRLNVQLRSESATLITALNRQLATLQAALRSQGLEVDRVVCLHGNPVDDANPRLTRLLDLHA